MFRAVDIGLVDFDRDPAFDKGLAVSIRISVSGQFRGGFIQRTDSSRPVYVKAHSRVEKIYEDKADVRVFRNIPETREHAIPSKFWVGQFSGLQNFDESRRTESRRTVAIPLGVGRGHKDHLLPTDQLLHLLRQIISNLTIVKALGAVPSSPRALQVSLAS